MPDSSEDPPAGGPAPDGAAPHGPTSDGPTSDGPASDGPAQHDTIPGGTAPEGSAPGGTAPDGPATPAPVAVAPAASGAHGSAAPGATPATPHLGTASGSAPATAQLDTAPGADPDGPRRGRVVLLVLACLLVAALVSALVGTVRSGGRAGDAPSSAGRTVTLSPEPTSDAEAAARHGWTLVARDEFDGDELDEDLWSPYRGRTTGDVGQHDPDNLSVGGGTLKLTSRGDTSAGMAWNEGQRYGRWEARVRSERGNGYGPVLLLWPDSEEWPEDGEINLMEVPDGDRSKAHFTVHWGEENNQDGVSVVSDFTQWHTFAVEWTPEHIVGYVDGEEVYRNDDADAAPPGPMHLALQQDVGPYGDDWIPARDASTPETCTFEVDWVRIYAA